MSLIEQKYKGNTGLMMMSINGKNDIHQVYGKSITIVLKPDWISMFSKSFSYALRGILYIALLQDENRNVHVNEIAEQLAVPRHFMGKILKMLVKHNILYSTKGPNGGFKVNELTLSTPVLKIVEITDGLSAFNNCVLRLHKCDSQNPCPLHYQMESIKETLKKELTTTIGELLNKDKNDFLKSITTIMESQPLKNPL